MEDNLVFYSLSSPLADGWTAVSTIHACFCNVGKNFAKNLSTPLHTLILKNSVRNFSDVGLRRPKLRCYASSFAMQEAKTETQPHTKNDSFGVVLHVNGMKCGGCSAAVKRLLLESEEAKQIGVMNVSVNLLTKTVVVKLQEDRNAKSVVDLLNFKGWEACVAAGDQKGKNFQLLEDIEERRRQKRIDFEASNVNIACAWALALGAFISHLGHHFHHLGLHNWAHTPFLDALEDSKISVILALLALIGPGRGIVTDGAMSAYQGRPNMNTLVTGGALASLFTGTIAELVPDMNLGESNMCFDEPVLLLAFVTLGRAMELRAKARATEDLHTIAQLVPSRCKILLENEINETVTLPTSSVNVNDVVLVTPGDRIPVDGTVISGTSLVDESLMTGESNLVPKESGDPVTAGTVSWDGVIQVQVTKHGSENYVSQIVKMVRDAQSREAPIQRFADTISVPFVTGVMMCSLATFAFWYGIGTEIFPNATDLAASSSMNANPLSPLMLSISLATNVLVIACPCALGLATPTAVMVGTSVGARKGLLLRGGDVIESLSSVDTIVLDKTGTLTTGQMSVTKIEVTSSFINGESWTADKLLHYAAAVERGSNHPIARAVVSKAEAHEYYTNIECESLCVEEMTTCPGRGAKAFINGREVYIGSHQWIKDQMDTSNMKNAVDALSNVDGTRIHVAVGGIGIIGSLVVKDQLRDDARRTIRELQNRNIDVRIMSGDSKEAVQKVAFAVGLPLTATSSRMLPEEKMNAIKKLQIAGHKVAMVGDGINDTPALTVADVGISIESGTDAANNASGVLLMSGGKGNTRLMQIPESIDLARKTVTKIKQNLVWALAYNAMGIPIAAGALLPMYGISLTPATAGAFMAFSSVSVLTNSLMLSLLERESSKKQKHDSKNPLPMY